MNSYTPLGLFLSLATTLCAQSIINPHWDDPDWKNWYQDPEPLVNSSTGAVLAIPEPEHRIYPADVPVTEANSDIFLHHLGEDYPGRPYAGIHGDLYVSYDGYHSSFKEYWSDGLGNFVDLKPNNGYALQRLESGQLSGFSTGYHEAKRYVGLMYSTFSIFGGGAPGWTRLRGIQEFEKRGLYANNAWTAQGTGTGYSLGTNTSEEYTRYVPLMYMSRGHSGSASMMTTKYIITSGYLHRDLKPEIIRNGLMGPTLHYLMRSALPYDVPWESELRHAAGMWSDGYNSYQTGHPNVGYRTIENIDDFGNEYDRHAHLRNMVQAAKELTVIPPVVEMEFVELISGQHAYGDTEQTLEASGAADTSSHGYLQPFGSDFEARIKVAALDPNGLPTDLHWALVIGDKRTSVVDEGGGIHRIHIPHDPDLPAGRTTLIVWANNGVTNGLPSAINVLRSDIVFPGDNEPERNWADRLPAPTGYERDSEWVPGETVTFDLHAPAPSGYPTTWIKWEGVGEMDGNRFIWEIPTDQVPGEHYAVMIGSDRTNGLGQQGAKALIRVKDVAARPEPRFSIGFGSQTVNFDASGSAAKDGQPLTYEWDFDGDGTPDATGSTASHTFSTPGIHEVIVTANSASLGTSDSTPVYVEVRPESWSAEIWEDGSSAPDPAVWNHVSGSVIASGGKWEFEDTEDVDGNMELARLETVTAPARPFAVEMIHESSSSPHMAYLSVCGLAIGTLQDHFGENYELGRETAPGEISGIEPLSGDLAERDSFRLTRVYVRDDPNNSGKIIISGLVRNAFGEFPFYRDNWDPGDGKVAMTGKKTRLIIDDFRLWQPAGDYPSPAFHLTDANGRTIMQAEGWSLDDSHFDRIVHDQSDFGVAEDSSPVERTFTIRNFGGSDLELTWDAPDYVQIMDMDGFALMDPVDNPVIPSAGAETFTLQHNPSGERQGALLRFNSNIGSPRFAFVGRLISIERDIAVEGRNVLIASEDSTPDAFDGTYFGNAANTESIEHRFLVRNRGRTPLALNPATLSNTTDFSITRQHRSPLHWDESSELRIAFHPASAGVKTATVTIPSDDPDTPSYTFEIQGNGLGSVAPEIDVSGDGNFGDVPWTDAPTSYATQVFTISNTGDAPLRLTGDFPHAEFSGADADAFSVYRAAQNFIHPGDSAELTVLFHPTRAGTHSATLTIYANDADEPQTQFSLSGNGLAAPAIEVRSSGGLLIENGDRWPRRDDDTDFGTLTSSGNVDKTYTIHNLGTSALAVTSADLSGDGAGEFSVVSLPSSIAAGATGQLTLRFNPSAAASYKATLTLNSDDPRTPQWSFDVAGSLTGLRSRGDRGVDRSLWRGNSQRGIAWGDYDNDGDLDVLLAGSTLLENSAPDWNEQFYGKTTLYENNGSGTFSEVATNLPNLDYAEAAWGDYDGDGDLDLVIGGGRHDISTFSYTAETEIYRNDNGAFFPISAGLPGLLDGEFVWVDYDHDGDLDLFMIGNQSNNAQSINAFTRLYRNDNGTFTDSGVSFPETFYGARSVWTDANGDGHVDAFIIGKYGIGYNRLDVGFGDGAGGFTWTLLEDEIANNSADWMDIDADGLLDIVTCHRIDSTNELVVYQQNVGGTFTRIEPQSNTPNSPTQFVAGDLDSDGYADVAMHLNFGYNDERLGVAFNQGGMPATLSDSSELTRVGGTEVNIGDFSGDGVNDIFSTGRNWNTSASTFYFGEGAVNSPPSSPGSLDVAETETGGLHVTWESATDPDFSGSEAIRYDVRIGTAPGLGDVKPALGDSSGYRRTPSLGSIGSTSYTLNRALPPGLYYVAVQAVDPGFAGSSWIEVEHRIEADLNAVDDSLSVSEEGLSTLNVLANDGVPFLSEITEVTQPLYGEISIAGDGQSLRYDPQGYWGQHGAISFTYTLTDFDESGGVESAPQTATVTLTVADTRTDTDSIAGRTVTGIGLATGDYAARTRIDGDMHLQAVGTGTIATDSDKLLFAHRELSGDFSETLRVRNIFGSGVARAGLMARVGTEADAAFAQVSTGVGDQFHSNYRDGAGATSSIESSSNPSPMSDFPDRWVRIARNGNTLSLAWSTDGTTFTQQESLDISAWNATTLLVGEFVSSGDPTFSANALLGDISFAALDDNASTSEAQSIIIDVLANDSTNGGATITAVSQPAFGSVSIRPDDTLSFNPSGYYGWDGSVSFTYTAEEDGVSATATVTVTVSETEPHSDLPGFDFDGLTTYGSGASDGRIPTATSYLEVGTRGGLGLSQTSASDSLTFLYREALGDFKAIVRLRDFHGFAESRAGLMLREDGGNRPRSVWIGVNPSADGFHQSRTTANTAANQEQAANLPSGIAMPDLWLRIERYRDTVRIFSSSDGTIWSQAADSIELSDLAGMVRIGTFLYSGGTPKGAQASFDAFSLDVETLPDLANGGVGEDVNLNLTSTSFDDWKVAGIDDTLYSVFKDGGSGRIGEWTAVDGGNFETRDNDSRNYHEFSWTDGAVDPGFSGSDATSRTDEQPAIALTGTEGSKARIEIPVGRAEGRLTVYTAAALIFTGTEIGYEVTFSSNEPDVEPRTFSYFRAGVAGKSISVDYTSARPNTVITIEIEKIHDSSSGDINHVLIQGITLTRTEIPGGDGGPPFFLPVNSSAPLANDDTFTIVGDSSWLLDVTANDTDPDLWQGTPQLNALVSLPANGTAQIQDGKVSYTPANGFYGSDTLTYNTTDGGFTSNVATVDITILDPADPTDSDADGLPDVFELAAYGDLSQNGSGDFDGDGVTDSDEITLGRNPAGTDRVTLDFLEDFERGPGSLADYPGMWTLNSDEPNGEIKDSIGASSSKGLELLTGTNQNAELTLHLPNHWQAASWKQFQATLAPFVEDAEHPEIDEGTAVAFYLTESGDLWFRDGTVWKTLDLNLDPEAMHLYTVYQDYTSEIWKLWINGILRTTGQPPAFAHPVETPSYFLITQGSEHSSIFDNIAVRSGPPSVALGNLQDYGNWKSGIAWNGEGDGETDDPNNNAISNLLEYAFGFDEPVSGTHSYSTAIQMEAGTEDATFTFRRNRQAEDLVFTVQTSADLSPDSWIEHYPPSANVSIEPAPGEEDVDLITVTLPMLEEKTFVRLRVTAP